MLYYTFFRCFFLVTGGSYIYFVMKQKTNPLKTSIKIIDNKIEFDFVCDKTVMSFLWCFYVMVKN